MILSIDPSSRSCGWALFKNSGEYFSSGTINSNKKDFLKNFIDIADKLEAIFLAECGDKHDTILIEYPEYFSSNTGITALRSGSLVKLSMMVGVIIGVFIKYSKTKIILIKPKEWKGNLSKKITMERVMDKINIKKIKTFDESDAIGIGLYYIGKF